MREVTLSVALLAVVGFACGGCAVPGAGVRVPGVIDLREKVVQDAIHAPPLGEGEATAFGRIGDIALSGPLEDDRASRAMAEALAEPGVMLCGIRLSTLDWSLNVTVATMQLRWTRAHPSAALSASPAQTPTPTLPPAKGRRK